MKLKVQTAVVIQDKHGQTINLFDTEKHALEYVKTLAGFGFSTEQVMKDIKK